ncbi:MAG: hypothetical protein QXZ70_05380 [Candidatus Bathyarchaeia archaeon]
MGWIKKGETQSLIEFYADDAEYLWYSGPNEPWFVAKGAQEIHDYALGTECAGHKGWKYPLLNPMVIDPVQGIVVVFMDTVAPEGIPKREDGTTYHVQGPGLSMLWYAGNGKWRRQIDLFDIAGYNALFKEMIEKKLMHPDFVVHMKEHWERSHSPDYKKKLKEFAEQLAAKGAIRLYKDYKK